jgi:pyrroline-5-carboxylate reductase
MMLANRQIAFLGGGHIAEIIIRRLVEEQVLAAPQILVSDPAPARCEHLADRFGITPAADNVEAAQRGDLVLVCVRPEVVQAIVSDLQTAGLRPEQVVVSIAAGIPLATYEALGDQQPLVRALPNPPSQVGQGIAPLVFSAMVSATQRALVLELFDALGDTVEVEESHLNAITSLSSPVATYLFLQSLVDAGVSCGLPHAVATRVASQTIVGSLAVWRSRQAPPSELINEASTPGGVSVETVRTLKQHELEATVADAIAQGTTRAAELGQEFAESE